MQIARQVGVTLSAAMASKFNTVFVLGAPGAGKGTQCAKIVEVRFHQHYSVCFLLCEDTLYRTCKGPITVMTLTFDSDKTALFWHLSSVVSTVNDDALAVVISS